MISGLTLLVIIAGAAVARLLASNGDLWLDEIWSIVLATKVQTPLDVVTAIHQDNNHPLNTLLMRALGDQENWVVYRLPAVLAGTAAVIISAMLSRRRGWLEIVTSMLLTGSSYLLIHYSSEARGYALVVPLALLSFYLMECYLEGRRWVAGLLCPVVVLGFLSHLAFIHVYVALVVWSLLRFIQGRRGWSSVVLEVAGCHLVPVIFLILFYHLHVQHLGMGGGPPKMLLDTILRTAALTLGAPETGVLAKIAGAAALPILCAGLAALWPGRSQVWLFYVIVILLSPALLVVVRPPEFVAVRYFLVSVVFFLLLLGRLLALVYRQGRWGQAAYVGLILLIVGGNSRYTWELIRDGRGHYADAVRYMFEHTRGRVVSVGSDHDFRNKLVLLFYARNLDQSKRLTYVDDASESKRGPRWFLTHRLDPADQPPPLHTTPAGQSYRLERTYGYSRLSGCQWFLYRRIPR